MRPTEPSAAPTIRCAFVTTDYTTRAEPAGIPAALDALAADG
ncbi:hypothetical protein [Streptomyces sp. CB03238]|nr:hypothetical protein [Streptomyces sp. CB03238]